MKDKNICLMTIALILIANILVGAAVISIVGARDNATQNYISEMVEAPANDFTGKPTCDVSIIDELFADDEKLSQLGDEDIRWHKYSMFYFDKDCQYDINEYPKLAESAIELLNYEKDGRFFAQRSVDIPYDAYDELELGTYNMVSDEFSKSTSFYGPVSVVLVGRADSANAVGSHATLPNIFDQYYIVDVAPSIVDDSQGRPSVYFTVMEELCKERLFGLWRIDTESGEKVRLITNGTICEE